jgi:redox-regulated HSP33 family molecular chaperone
MYQAILTLAGQDLGDLLEREEGLEVRCEFCRQNYLFSQEELIALFAPHSSRPQ